MSRKRMVAISCDSRLLLQGDWNNHGVIVEEIEGLIRLYEDGYIERPPIIPSVPCTAASEDGVTARDVVIDRFTHSWARIYDPSCHGKFSLLVYFHEGGFCVGSTAWSCYHEFLANLAFKSGPVVLSIKYRLAPENRLPASYDDEISTLSWVKDEALNGSLENMWWLNGCNWTQCRYKYGL